MSRLDDETADHSFLAGGGELGRLMRALDWSTTPLGSIKDWSQSLRTAVSICLTSRFPMVIYWGPAYVTLYNDAYGEILARKHPWALGRGAREVWAEIWDVISPMLDGVMATGKATWSDDLLLILRRHGYSEECYFSFSFSPARVEGGGIGGVFTAVAETTSRVLGERRQRTLRELAARAGQAKTAGAACRIAAETLARDPKDVPFALLYLIDADRKRARLAGTAAINTGEALSPLVVDLGDEIHDEQPWPLAEVARDESIRIAEELSEKSLIASPGPWSEPPDSAVVLPVFSNMTHPVAGLLVLGVSSLLRFDDHYRDFFELVASQVATAIGNARAHEAERKRAEALAEIDRAKTAFFSNVSHEFRTPLTLMLDPIEDMLARADGAFTGSREELGLLHRNALRLFKLVNALLDFSRIEAHRVEPSYEPIDLSRHTAELASVFRSAIEKAGLKLLVDCPTLPKQVYVDREMWEKIVLNLLSNAFKFTFEGEIKVGLRWCGERVELAVVDTGVGIPETESQRIFDRFHRVRNTRSRTHEGTGIGLALVRELVKFHGGEVTVRSAEGRGTTFCVSIPTGARHLPKERVGARRDTASVPTGATPYVQEALGWLLPETVTNDKPPMANEASDTESRASVASESTDSSRAPRQPSLILLADDNADMRAYLRRLLAPEYEVIVEADGATALAAAREHKPELVLTDVMMPRLDGFELLQALRADSRTRNIPVILLSARAGEESRVEGLAAGANDYLIKPFSAHELRARVRNLISMKRARDALQRELVTQNEDLSQLTHQLIASRQALRRSEAYLAEGQRLSHTGSWAWNISTGELFWSEEQYRIFGLNPEKVRPSLPMALQLIHPDDRAFVQQAFDQAVRETRDSAWDGRILASNGTIKHVHTTIHPVFNKSRNLTECIGTTMDITERKQAEAALTKAFKKIRTFKDQLAQEKLYLEEEIRTEQGFEEIIGENAALKHTLKEVEIMAPTDSTALIQGETGSGKELIARAIHKLSARRERTFVKINCAAIPTGLLEAELFGHEKGAFTGAISQRIGRFELANRGTIFLDEIGDIPLELQVKLLRVLQEREFERLGSTRTISVDVRIIAASNRDLDRMAADREFRSDLYYRLKVFPITVPPLRERVEDIPLLARHFTQRHARKLKKRITSIGSETMTALCGYPWPGNVREMENFIERSVILSRGSVLNAPLGELDSFSSQALEAATLEDIEREHILRILKESAWIIAGPEGAAAKLGMKRTTLQYKMQKLGITRPN